MTGKPQVCTTSGCVRKPVARRLCRAHYQQAWKAGELGQHKPLPTREINRVICPPSHKHALSTTCYIQHQCRCDECIDHATARENSRNRLIAYGRYDSGLVDAEPVRDHVMRLSEYGIGYKRVAQLSGVHTTVVRTLVWGREEANRKGELPKRMKRVNAERILAVEATVENLGRRQAVPSLGAVRRVQALVACGWSITKIGNRLHASGENFWGVIQKDTIGAGLYRRIRVLYEELWDSPPPADTHRDKISVSRSKKYAKDRGWLPPMAWDDIDTDPEPENVRKDRAGYARHDGEAILEDAEWLIEAGETPAAIAATLGRSLEALQRLAYRHGRDDLAPHFYDKDNRRSNAA